MTLHHPRAANLAATCAAAVKAEMREWTVTAKGRSKGLLFRKHGRWCWFRNNGATQVYPRDMRKDEVRESIARDCLVETKEVEFK